MAELVQLELPGLTEMLDTMGYVTLYFDDYAVLQHGGEIVAYVMMQEHIMVTEKWDAACREWGNERGAIYVRPASFRGMIREARRLTHLMAQLRVRRVPWKPSS